MAIEEFEIHSRPLKEHAQSFLKKHWASLTLDDIYPLVLLQSERGKKPKVYPIIPIYHAGPHDKSAGVAVGSSSDNCLLFQINHANQEIVMSWNLKDVSQWAVLGDIRKKDELIYPRGGIRSIIDYIKLGFLQKKNSDGVVFHSFGELKDKLTGMTRDLTLIQFSRIPAGGSPEYKRIKTVNWIEENFKKKRIELGGAHFGGTIVETS